MRNHRPASPDLSEFPRPYVALLAGGIASGKSTVARELGRLGARRIDLDRLSREALAPGGETTRRVAVAFGADLLDARTGRLDRRLLAERAFSSEEAAALLEEIELPAIVSLLREGLTRAATEGVRCCVVEVPLLDRLERPRDLADEVVVVACPLELRRARAVARGMEPVDFDARAARQPDDAWLCARADTIIENLGTAAELEEAARSWWDERRAWWASATL